MPAAIPPFVRTEVDYALRGTATISWTIDPRFYEPEPWTFQLQVGEADLTADTTVWANVGGPLVGSHNTLATDSQARAFGKEATVFYRVQLVTSASPPSTYYSPPAAITGDLDLHSWRLMQEMVRKDSLRLARLKVGVGGLLLKNKRSGTPCTRCTNTFTQEQTDGACPVCFGQRFVGGFYLAQAQVYVDMGLTGSDPHLEENLGSVNPATVRSGHFVGSPTVAAFDVFVANGSDERYYLRNKQVAAHIRGVPFCYQMELRLAPFSDIIYQVPVPPH